LISIFHFIIQKAINMTNSYKDLLQQREALEKQIAEARRNETSAAVAQVRALVAEFGLTANDIFTSGRAPRGAASSLGSKVAPKYRNAATGETWTGRGKAPKWIADQDRSKFLIA
jgi:DNA-binding protein H-NS